jgi:hypothetical protein
MLARMLEMPNLIMDDGTGWKIAGKTAAKEAANNLITWVVLAYLSHVNYLRNLLMVGELSLPYST